MKMGFSRILSKISSKRTLCKKRCELKIRLKRKKISKSFFLILLRRFYMTPFKYKRVLGGMDRAGSTINVEKVLMEPQ